jgi:hypothetical protein
MVSSPFGPLFLRALAGEEFHACEFCAAQNLLSGRG